MRRCATTSTYGNQKSRWWDRILIGSLSVKEEQRPDVFGERDGEAVVEIGRKVRVKPVFARPVRPDTSSEQRKPGALQCRRGEQMVQWRLRVVSVPREPGDEPQVAILDGPASQIEFQPVSATSNFTL